MRKMRENALNNQIVTLYKKTTQINEWSTIKIKVLANE